MRLLVNGEDKLANGGDLIGERRNSAPGTLAYLEEQVPLPADEDDEATVVDAFEFGRSRSRSRSRSPSPAGRA